MANPAAVVTDEATRRNLGQRFRATPIARAGSRSVKTKANPVAVAPLHGPDEVRPFGLAGVDGVH